MAMADVAALVARHGMSPMLATAADLPAGDPGWAYEMKWDGVRAIAYASGGEVRLVSRTGRDITGVYPALGRLPVLDGEIVAFGGGEWPSFEALQQRMNISSPAQARALATRDPVSFLAFDLLVLDGEELAGLPYSQRRERLEGLGLTGGFWQVPPSVPGQAGADLLAVARQNGLEGVVAKRLDSRYEPGRRSAAWLKHKILRRQEVVVGGWKPGEGRRAGGIGSLLIGVQSPAGLEYAGHVGTGFTDRALDMLHARLAPLRRPASPFASTVPPEYARAAQWVEPLLVIEVEFARWTSAGRMRAPS